MISPQSHNMKMRIKTLTMKIRKLKRMQMKKEKEKKVSTSLCRRFLKQWSLFDLKRNNYSYPSLYKFKRNLLLVWLSQHNFYAGHLLYYLYYIPYWLFLRRPLLMLFFVAGVIRTCIMGQN